jgi:ribose transport system permease protein
MIGVIAVFIFLQNRTLLGKYSYAIGSNEQAALLAGVPVKKIKYTLLILTGLLCGIAGVILTSRSMSGGPLSASGMEFDIILAVLLGGTALDGGEGKIWGMVFGALILGVVRNSMNLIGLAHTYKFIATGAIFILAIMLNKVLKGEKIGTL